MSIYPNFLECYHDAITNTLPNPNDHYIIQFHLYRLSFHALDFLKKNQKIHFFLLRFNHMLYYKQFLKF